MWTKSYLQGAKRMSDKLFHAVQIVKEKLPSKSQAENSNKIWIGKTDSHLFRVYIDTNDYQANDEIIKRLDKLLREQWKEQSE